MPIIRFLFFGNEKSLLEFKNSVYISKCGQKCRIDYQKINFCTLKIELIGILNYSIYNILQYHYILYIISFII